MAILANLLPESMAMSDFIFPSLRNCDLFDDFAGAQIDSTDKRVTSQLGWGYDGDGSVTQAASPSAGAPGEIHLLTGDVSTNATYLFAGSSFSGTIVNVSDIQSFEWRVKPSATAHLIGMIGMGSNIADPALGSDALGFRIAIGGGITTVAIHGSVEDTQLPGASISTGAWSRLVALKLSATLWRMLVLDEAGIIAGVTEHTAHLPTGGLTLGVNGVCSGASSGGQHFKLDLAALRLRPGIRI